MHEADFQRIEWLCVSSSDDLPFQPFREVINGARPAAHSPAEVHEKRVATVEIKPVFVSVLDPQRADMELIDYFYFSIYTITTTGYGDIMPTTPYAKFLCTLENIYEVFFLVIFFSVLLSLPRSGRIYYQQPDFDPDIPVLSHEN